MTHARTWLLSHIQRSIGTSRPTMFINLLLGFALCGTLLGLAFTGLTGCDYPTSGQLNGPDESTDIIGDDSGDQLDNSVGDESNDESNGHDTGPNSHDTDPLNGFSLTPDYQPAISQEQAKQIALQDLDPRFYEATFFLLGPMEWPMEGSGNVITAYEVTVQGSDHSLLRYIDAETGEFLYDERMELPAPDDSVDPTGPPLTEEELAEFASNSDSSTSEERNYYTSCPSGWPLCIRNPAQITFYSQRDPTWRNDKLGYSNVTTIGSHGCLLSVYAMSLKQTGHGTRNPRQLNNDGKSWGCFSGDLINSSCIANRTGSSYSVIGVNQVWSTIASGIPVVIYGYSPCMGGNHAQMIWGHDGARYWTKDPWYDWTNQDRAMCVNNPSFRTMR